MTLLSLEILLPLSNQIYSFVQNTKVRLLLYQNIFHFASIIYLSLQMIRPLDKS